MNNYHSSLDFYHRRDFPAMFKKLPHDLGVLVDQVKANKCKGVITPLIYNLTEWLLTHLYGRGVVYALRFEEMVIPILRNYCEDTSTTSRTFGTKFYLHVRRVIVGTRVEGRKVRARRPKNSPGEKTLVSMTDVVSKMSMLRICFLAKEANIATKNKFLTSFCHSILSELGVTSVRVTKTFIYRTYPGDHYLIRRQVIKAVMIQLRLRICAEAQSQRLLNIGEIVPFSSKPRTLLKIGKTGMLVVPQVEGKLGKSTYLDPIYYPLLIAIENALTKNG